MRSPLCGSKLNAVTQHADVLERLLVVGRARVDVAVAVDGEGDLVALGRAAQNALEHFFGADLCADFADHFALFAEREIETAAEEQRRLPLAFSQPLSVFSRESLDDVRDGNPRRRRGLGGFRGGFCFVRSRFLLPLTRGLHLLLERRLRCAHAGLEALLNALQLLLRLLAFGRRHPFPALCELDAEEREVPQLRFLLVGPPEAHDRRRRDVDDERLAGRRRRGRRLDVRGRFRLRRRGHGGRRMRERLDLQRVDDGRRIAHLGEDVGDHGAARRLAEVVQRQRGDLGQFLLEIGAQRREPRLHLPRERRRLAPVRRLHRLPRGVIRVAHDRAQWQDRQQEGGDDELGTDLHVLV
jgi:hypothetical protein